MYNVSRYPAKTTISATNHSVPEILFRKIMSGYSGTCEKKSYISWKILWQFVSIPMRFPIYFPFYFLESYHNIRQVFLKKTPCYPQNAIYGSRRIMSVSEKYKNKNQIKNIAPVNILSLVLIKTIQVPLFCFLLRFNLLHRIASNKVHNQFTVPHQKTLLYL